MIEPMVASASLAYLKNNVNSMRLVREAALAVQRTR